MLAKVSSAQAGSSGGAWRARLRLSRPVRMRCGRLAAGHQIKAIKGRLATGSPITRPGPRDPGEMYCGGATDRSWAISMHQAAPDRNRQVHGGRRADQRLARGNAPRAAFPRRQPRSSAGTAPGSSSARYRTSAGSRAHTATTPPTQHTPPETSENLTLVRLAVTPDRSCPADGPMP